ncbi:MAG: FAD-binding oxidoreductase, partial [Planctomycetes bacterium]|nr:FAD-binding oxidoreductase [Planctomycetota bacterium]
AAPVLLEAGEVATRASGRNDGQVLLGLGEHYNRIVGQFGPERARVLWDYIAANHERIEREAADFAAACGFERSGGLRLAETEHEFAELVESAELLDAEGIDHELLDAEATQRRLPASRGYFGSLFLPGECVVQPAALVRGLATRARTAGARIHERAEVVKVAADASEHVVTLRDGHVIRCAIVVHCTSTLARDLDASGFLAEQVFPFRGQIIATDALPAATLRDFGPYAMSSNFCYEYFRVHDGRFVIGGMRWSVPGEQQNLTDDSTHDDRITQNLRRYVADHFPVLDGVPFPWVWTGIMAGTGDGLPLCGELPGQPGVFALLGFNGYGLSFACEAGVSLSEQILEGRASHQAATMLLPRRFR